MEERDRKQQTFEPRKVTGCPEPINPVKATWRSIIPKKAAPEPIGKPLSASDFWTITGDKLVQHWGVDASIIEQFILEHGLPVRDSINSAVIDVEAYKTSYRRDLEKIQFKIYLKEGPFNRFQFRPCDIEAFEKQYGVIFEEFRKQSVCMPDLTTTETPQQVVHDDIKPEAFIRNLQISFSSDTSIFIKPNGKELREYSCEDMKFKPGAKTWKLLMEVLQNSSREYYAGKYSADRLAEKNRGYNKNVRLLANFSEKFIAFLNKTYGVQIPENFNVFENKHRTGEDRPGTHVPKFRIIPFGDDIKKLSKEETLQVIEVLSRQLKEEKSEEAKDRLGKQIKPYVDHALLKNWITQQEFTNLLLSDDETPSPDDALAYTDDR